MDWVLQVLKRPLTGDVGQAIFKQEDSVLCCKFWYEFLAYACRHEKAGAVRTPTPTESLTLLDKKCPLFCLRTKEWPLLKTWGKKSIISFAKYLTWLQTSGPGLLYCCNTYKMLLEHLLMASSVPTSVMPVVQRCSLPMARFLTYAHTNVLLKIWTVHLASQINSGQE